MKLLFKGEEMGVITGRRRDEMGFCGSIQLLPAAEKYKPLFDWLINQEDSPPFDEEFFENWDVEDDDGVRHDIVCPCIDNNYTTIEWRQ